MNGVHDMGGMQDMGAVQRETNEPVFHAAWEGRVYAMRTTLGGKFRWNGYAFRHQRDQISPAEYYGMSYYERWFVGLVEMLVNAGVLTREEVTTGKLGTKSATTPPQVAPANTTAPAAARFRVGDRVRSRNMHPTTYTRLPRYARGKIGTINRDHGVFAFADTAAHYLGDKPQHVYSVRFAARELWGEKAAPQDGIYLDMWDDYLEPT